MLAVCGLSTAEAKGPAVASAPSCWACDLLLEVSCALAWT